MNKYIFVSKMENMGDLVLTYSEIYKIWEICNYLFPAVTTDPGIYSVHGKEGFFEKDREFCPLFGGCNFEVTKEDASLMSRMLNNFLIIQEDISSQEYSHFRKPYKVGNSLQEKIKKSAEWLKKSEGFIIS